MARQMPKEGYYVYKADPAIFGANYISVYYTTGIRGGGGHKSCCSGGTLGGSGNWNTLLWTCIPCVELLARDYTYYPSLPPGIPPIPVPVVKPKTKRKYNPKSAPKYVDVDKPCPFCLVRPESDCAACAGKGTITIKERV